MSNDLLKVCAIPADLKGTISQLRIIHPFESLKARGLISPDSEIFELKADTLAAAGEAWGKFDVLWFHVRLAHTFMQELLMARVRNPNIRMVADLDDNIFEIPAWNPVVTKFSTEPLLYGDQLVRPAVDKNMFSRQMAEAFLMEVDAVVTTQPRLAARLSEYNKNIFVMPNTLRDDLWLIPNITRRSMLDIVIGWQGGNTHLMDWTEAHLAIKYLLANERNVKLEIMTAAGIMDPFTKTLPQDKVREFGFVSYDAHPYRSAIFRPDIGLCPLHRDAFNVCKSDLKFTEYAILGVPVVASNVPPYSDTIEHGETGFLADTMSEWVAYLSLLINNKDERARIGENARKWALQNRLLSGRTEEWANTLKDIAALPGWFNPTVPF